MMAWPTQLVGILAQDSFAPFFNQLAECLNLRCRAPGKLKVEEQWLRYDLPQRHFVGRGRGHDFRKCRIAYAARRVVDDALQRLFVVGVGDHTEVGYHVLDLLALVERHAAIDAVGYVHLAHLLLKAAALRIGAVQDGEVAVLSSLLTLDPDDVVAHNHGLFLVAIGGLQCQLVAVLIAAEHLFRYLALVLANQAVGGLHDELGGTVVLLELEETSICVGLTEVQDVVDVGAAEAIDALSIVANDTHALALTGQLKHYLLLGIVGVLILVDQHIKKTLNILATHVLVLLKE